MLRLCVIISLIYNVVSKNEVYSGHRVYKVQLSSQDQQENLELLRNDAIDFLRKPSWKHHKIGRAMVPASHFEWFEEKLAELKIKKEVIIEDVYEYLKLQEDMMRTDTRNEETFNYNKYFRYNEIIDYMNKLKVANNTTSVDLIEFGKTEENRTLVYMKITSNDNTQKPVIIIEGGIIPREWITIPAALYVAERILAEQKHLDLFDWIVIPVLNPDGYEYTHTNRHIQTTENIMDCYKYEDIFIDLSRTIDDDLYGKLRLWAKTRSMKTQFDFICPGANIDRNFDIDWASHADSSTSPCSHAYAGVEPFSEIESQLIKNLVNEYGNRIRLYISLQNNGGFISYPWNFERAASGLFREHHLFALKMIDAMNGVYEADVRSEALGLRASGTSTDYVRENGGFYTFNIEIGNENDDDVEMPENDILEVVQDVWRAVDAAASNIV